MQKAAGSNKISQKIIDYQEAHHMTDAEFALASHFTVEKIHGFKTMSGNPPTKEEETELLQFMQTKSFHS